jgi:sulfhydrogenase subunit alpha
MTTKIIEVNYLARVEGEGALYIKLNKNKVEDVKLKIFEPPRFFEAFMRGRGWEEAPDITSRICGICPVAYQMSAAHAMESIVGFRPEGMIRELRRLLYCGEWIESHLLHMFMLHVPDFVGVDDVVQLAKKEPELVRSALQLKKLGNELVSITGGREIHPINVKLGGFYSAPPRDRWRELLPRLRSAQNTIESLVVWLSRNLSFPDLERKYEYVCLSHPSEYPFNEGRIISSEGLDIDVAEYEDHFEEIHIPYTHALQSRIKGRGSYFCGPLARFNLHFEKLPEACRKLSHQIGIERNTHNPFKSLLVRGIESLFCFIEAERIVNKLVSEKYDPAIELKPRAGNGFGATEAPRGLLYHRYQIDADGKILDAKIVPPTSQNQSTIEDDLRELIPNHIHKPKAELTHLCEQAIRNYDPCISCATHFLKMHIDEVGQ